MSRQLDGTGMKRLHREWRRRSTTRVALVLDGIQGPYNVGAIVRTAAAYRVEHLWLAGATPTLDSGGVQKTALGTDRYLTTTRVAKAVDTFDAARAQGFRIVAVELTDDAMPLHEMSPHGAICLVLGHEDHGVSQAALAAADAVAFLPQLGRVGSLNVATAAALAVYEIRRREWDD
ncbi:MAG: TrmH family RNA methyltransferase [Acidimicrobiales bacterium]